MVLLSYNVVYHNPLIFLACLREHDLEAWLEFTRILKAPDRALTQIDYLEFKKRYNQNPAEDDQQLLKTYLYTRTFFDQADVDTIPIDFITKQAAEFFDKHFGVGIDQVFRTKENRELCDQIELVETFHKS